MGFELRKLFAESVLLLLLVGLHFFEGVTYLVADVGQFVGVELFGGDGVGDGVFHVIEADAGHRTEAALFRGADVVLVGAAVAGVLTVNETAVTSCPAAFFAVEQSSQEVEVDAVTVAFAVAPIEDLLHGEEEFLADDRFVTAWVEGPFVADDAGVVRVAQNHRELAGR
nr:hypothetical protein [Actinomyces polynesiensis]